MTLVNTKEARRQLGVHANTLRRWEKAGKIKAVRSPGGVRLYDTSTFVAGTRDCIIYTRVSSRGQKADLRKQVLFLREQYPKHEVIEDFGGGLNFKRKGFNSLLERIMSGSVEEVVVAHKDRLCRFGFGLIAAIASRYNTRLVVLDDTQLSPQEELVTDLISIVHVFSCRLYGLRKYGSALKKDKDLPKARVTEPS